MQNKIKKQKNTGYTIIETMIAVSLFLVVVMTGMGALLNANLLHQKSQDMRSIMDNLSFIMEDLSSSIRTGTSYHCIATGEEFINLDTKKSGQKCFGIAFEYSKGDPTNSLDQWVYYIGTNGVDNILRIFKSIQGPYNNTVNYPYTQLTTNEVEIDSISGFDVTGAEPSSMNDTQQPFVTIRLVGKITYKNIVTPFSLQTSVSERSIDI